MEILYKTKYGSELYGTNTANSDTDYKSIFLPPFKDILLSKSIRPIHQDTNTIFGVKNSKDDIDQEIIPLYDYANSFFNGKINALEIGFSVGCNHVEQTINDDFLIFNNELKTRFLTSNIGHVLGFIVKKASLFDMKTDRYEFLLEVQSSLSGEDERKLKEIINNPNHPFSSLISKYPKYLKYSDIIPSGKINKPCIVLMERVYELEITVPYFLESIQALTKKFKPHIEVKELDHKDVANSYRAAVEAIELLENKTITFPLSKKVSDKVKNIRAGKEDIQNVIKEIKEMVDKIDELKKHSDLPDSGKIRNEFEDFLAESFKMIYWKREKPVSYKASL